MNTVTEIKVWDPLVRLFHWTLVAAFAIAYFTGEELQNVHVWAGYTVLGLLGVRLLWGFIGTRYARFTDFVHSPRVILTYLKDVFTRKAPRHVGHNPAGGAMIILLLISLLATTLSGVALYGSDQGLGPFAGFLTGLDDFWVDALKEVHEFSANFTVALVIVHVGGVVWESVLHRENLVLAMINGRKRA
jgi:cytochrome b